VRRRLEPGIVDANLNLGNVWLDRGDPERAIAWFQRTLQLDPREARGWNGLGMAYLRLGEPDKAIPHFEQALTLDSQFGLARRGLQAACAMLAGAEGEQPK
jgi:Flp pilus assembly protein TadD